MAYDEINMKITRPDSVHDIQQCLSTSVQSAKLLCTHANVNKWARHKPVQHSELFIMTEDKYKEVNFGLNIPSYNNYLDAYNNGIGYNRPIGGSNSPYRLMDFDNYNHLAHAIFSAMVDIEANKLDGDICRINFMYNIGGGDDQIGLSDFIGLTIGSTYLAVILNDGNNTFIKTSDVNIDNGASYIDIPIKTGFLQNYIGTLNAKFVLCSLAVTELSMLSSITGNTYYPLLVDVVSNAMCNINIINYINMTMFVDKIGNTLTGLFSNIETYITTPSNPDPFYFATSNGTMFIRVSATNNSSNPVTITNNFALKAIPSLTGNSSGIVSSQLYDSNGNSVYSITIPANTSITFKLGAPNILFMNNGSLSTPLDPIQTQISLYAYYKSNSVNIAINGPINVMSN